MIGLGTMVNTAAIVVGGLLGILFGKFLKENVQQTLTKACGAATVVIAIAGAMEKMPQATGGGSLMMVICLCIGCVLGELMHIEDGIAWFGGWLRNKTGNSKDAGFVNAFLTASMTVCVGAMAIVGSIEDGLRGDPSILITKAVLDLVIIIAMTASLGKGAIFSAIPVALLQGSVTALAGLAKPVMTDLAMANLGLVGNVLILCVGVNLLMNTKIRVANMLPAVALAVAAAFLPI